MWDEDEGRWILQRRRLRRRTRRRTPFDGELEDDSESESGPYSEDDSGIAYNDDGTKSIADDLKEPSEELSLADKLKSPSSVRRPTPANAAAYRAIVGEEAKQAEFDEDRLPLIDRQNPG